ncbi:hypothetical protein [Hymenobacter mucosus]|uniref:Membrane domain of glycerophosphoryl diester phosphodiesterase n=1 Tax=Hymenobacter mucosus TaxID=1411120 RepID=A0A238W135_9BACT|nr:hypothetical protein [Hymenobacter mucosus]SNR40101.1 hypothetical protein SAMN06269173_102118 [Hymenobacter mucosus]
MRHSSFTQPSDFLQERNFGQKIEATFDFLRVHFRPLLRVLVVLVLPLALVTGIASGLLQSKLINAIRNVSTQPNSTIGFVNDLLTSPSYSLTILGGMLLFVVLQLTVYSYVLVSMNRPSPAVPVTISEVWEMVRKRFLGMLGVSLSLVLLFLVASMLLSLFFGLLGSGLATLSSSGAFFLIIPLTYIAIAYIGVTLSLFFIVWLRERKGMFASIRRCFQLIKGKWWSTFGLLIVVGLITTTVMVLLLSVLAAMAFPFVKQLSQLSDQLVKLLLIVAASLQSLAMLGVLPVFILAICFQYFNLVERHDGEGLYLQLASLGQAPPAAAPSVLQPDEEGEY